MSKAASSSSLFGSRSALIVEDSHLMRQLLRSLLRGFGFENISEAADGSEAITLLERRHCDVIICDWMMEPTDGFSFLGSLRQHPTAHLRGLPVIMLTSVAEEPRIMAARDAGVTEYLVKPVSADNLRNRLLAVFTNPRSFVVTDRYVGPDRRRRQIDLPDRPSRRAGDQPDELNNPGRQKDMMPTIDDYRAVLASELDRLTRFAQQIEDSEGTVIEPWSHLQHIAHDLKGQAGSFGFTVVGAIARRLDRLASPVLGRGTPKLIPTERRISAVLRHVDSLRLVFEHDIQIDSVETDALLERLDQAIERVEREALDTPPDQSSGSKN